jgi:hypothetical protein
MLSKSTNAIIPEQAVSYKFKVRDFADLFEGLNPEQIHVALEGAMNIVFVKPLPVAGSDENQTEEDDQLDHESQVTANTVFALVAHGQSDETEGVAEIDPEDNPEYAKYEEIFQAIVAKFAAEVAADEFNQDVVTLHGEMEYFNRIELFTYFYDTKNEVLSVTIISTPEAEPVAA